MHPIARRVVVAFAYFASGFTVRDILSFAAHKIYMWQERRIDNRLVGYLVRERERNPPAGTDSHGHSLNRYYRSSIEISKAIKRSAVDVRKRLERLEGEKRVQRPAPGADTWTATKYELHDHSVT